VTCLEKKLGGSAADREVGRPSQSYGWELSALRLLLFALLEGEDSGSFQREAGLVQSVDGQLLGPGVDQIDQVGGRTVCPGSRVYVPAVDSIPAASAGRDSKPARSRKPTSRITALRLRQPMAKVCRSMFISPIRTVRFSRDRPGPDQSRLGVNTGATRQVGGDVARVGEDELAGLVPRGINAVSTCLSLCRMYRASDEPVYWAVTAAYFPPMSLRCAKPPAGDSCSKTIAQQRHIHAEEQHDDKSLFGHCISRSEFD